MALAAKKKTQVLSHQEVQRKIERIAHQLFEQNHAEEKVIIGGIASRGSELARRIATSLESLGAFETHFLELTIDKDAPQSVQPVLSGELSQLDGRVVFLVDDVLQSGRTLMHAAAHLMTVSMKKLTTVALVDRRHRSFPIRADVVGLTLSTTMQDHISVRFGKKDAVYLD